ncbi:SagB/ThcOx family dehydrogenase [Haladaptatus cibarius]|uniref:SagB/ThcOx family dehydrogenase n=1 Tax=Haladaptatus cibarius TaxID=453847 RepID=UPI0006798700|nr:SagB/ThcOx family dehydrogenase [Haladaptatus cibarius]
MKVSVEQLRQFRSQHYDPTRQSPSDTYLDKYSQKEFSDDNIAELFHENTKYTEVEDFRLGPSAGLFTRETSFQFMQAKLAPDYRGKEKIELPAPEEVDERIDAVVASRRSNREHTGEGISLQQLSTLLQHSCGKTGEKAVGEPEEGDPVTKKFRAYASGGGLYPVEIYLTIPNPGPNLDAGLYYYASESHALRVLERDEDIGDRLAETYGISADIYDPLDSAVTFTLTGTMWRSMAKYGPRGYRFILQESGHLAQNMLLFAEAMGLGAVPLAGYYDKKMNDFLNVNGVDEASLYTVSIGQVDGGENDDE